MAKKVHINLKTGEVSVCRATKRCPFGSFETDHYPTEADAREAYESHAVAAFGSRSPSSRDKESFDEYSRIVSSIDFLQGNPPDEPLLIDFFSKVSVTPELFGLLMSSSSLSAPTPAFSYHDLEKTRINREHLGVRSTFTRYARLNTAQFKELLATEEYRGGGGIERNGSLPEELQLRVARGELGFEAKGGTGILLTYNPGLTEKTMEALLERGPIIRRSLAREVKLLPPAIKERLLADGHPEVTEALARRADTAASELEEIFKDSLKTKNPVTYALLSNKNTPAGVLQELEKLGLNRS